MLPTTLGARSLALGLGEIPYSQLNRRLGRWVDRYREVHVRPAAARAGAAEFLARTEEPVQLAVWAVMRRLTSPEFSVEYATLCWTAPRTRHWWSAADGERHR